MTRSLKQGYCLQLSRWAPNAIICIFIRGKQREISHTHTQSHTHTWRGEGKVTTVAKIGVMWPQVKECLKLEAGRGREWVLPWRIQNALGAWPRPHLDIGTVKLISDFGLQNCKRMNVCCFKLSVVGDLLQHPQKTTAVSHCGTWDVKPGGVDPNSRCWGRTTQPRVRQLESAMR